MSSLASTSTLRTAHHNTAKITFSTHYETGLSVTIKTDRLFMRSVQATETDHDHYAGLYGDPEVMGKFHTGETKPRAYVVNRIDTLWAKRWSERDPYSAIAVFEADSKDFLGHVVLGHGDSSGESELAYLFNKPHWGKRYGTEAVTAIVKEYAPATVREGYTLDGIPLCKINASARIDNLASCRILEGIGMQKEVQLDLYGSERNIYSINVEPPSEI